MSTSTRVAASLLALASVIVGVVATSSSSVLECLDPNQRRVAWADTEDECPTGSVPARREVIDACDPASCMPCKPWPCEPGPTCPEPVPVEYLCCEPVCGEQACEWISEASACVADNLIFECDCPYQHPTGAIECMTC
jgi:hypothetical protein